MKKILMIYGHGGNDPGASGNGINERDFYRKTLHPYLKKWADRSQRVIDFYFGNAYQDGYLMRINPSEYEVLELHMDAPNYVPTGGGHVIIHADYTPDDQDRRLASLINRFFGCRSGQCFSGRRDLKNPNIAKNRGINYRLIELCFITNATDVRKLMANLDAIAKGIVEALTGESLDEPKPTPKPTPIPTPKEDDMIEIAILIGSIADVATAEPVAIKLQAPIYLPGSTVKAKHLIVIGGKVPADYKGKVTNLSGKNRLETAAKVKEYLKY